MQIRGVETRDGHQYEEHGHCHICGSQPQRIFLVQLDLHTHGQPVMPGPWMVQITHASGSQSDHLIPAENIAFIRLKY